MSKQISWKKIITTMMMVILLLSVFVFRKISAQEAFSNPIQSMTSPPESLVILNEEQLTISFNKETNEWLAEEDSSIDSKQIWRLVTAVSQIEGEVLEPADLASEVNVTFTFIESDGQQHILSIYDDNQHIAYNEALVMVEELPDLLRNFSWLDLSDQIEIPIGQIVEIRYEDDAESFTLNQESNFSEVEKAPFITAWFLHQDKETVFSIKYQSLEKIYQAVINIRGQLLSDYTKSKNVNVQSIVELVGNEGVETLTFYDDGVMHLTNADEYYQISPRLLNGFSMDAMDLIDNFIALIPLDAIESVEIKGQDIDFILDVEAVVDGENVEFSYFLNDNEIEEATMRRAYQYLASLAYTRPATNEEQEIKNDSSIQIKYLFRSDGETIEYIIDFIPLNDSEYLVSKNNIREYVISQEALDTLVDAWQHLNK